MTTLAYWLVAAICGLLSAWVLAPWWRTQGAPSGLKPLASMPGPRQLPLLRNLPQFIDFGPPKLHLKYLQWMQHYGRLFRYGVPGLGDVVIVGEPALLESVVGRQGLPKAPIYEDFRVMTSKSEYPTLFTSLQAGPGSHYRHVRKSLAPFFATDNLREHVPLMRKKALKLADKLRQRGSNVPIDVEDAMARATLDTFMAAAGFGDLRALDFQPCKAIDLQHYVTAQLLFDFSNPFQKQIRRYLPFLPYPRTYRRMHEEVYQLWRDLAADLMRQPEPDPASKRLSLGDTLRKLMKEPADGRTLGMDWLQAEISELIGAGMDTTAQTMSFVLLSLALHPEVQDKVEQELRQAELLATPEQPEPRDLTWADTTSLPYLDAVLKESMRIWPVAGTGTGRIVPQDIELGGYHIPKGTVVGVPMSMLHFLPQFFPEPLSFRPERWLEPRTSSQSGDGPVKYVRKELGIESASYPFKPFSYGPRDCPGQRLAQVEMMTILPIILGRFKVTSAEQMGDWDACWQKQTFAFVLRLVGGIHMHFCDRAGQHCVA